MLKFKATVLIAVTVSFFGCSSITPYYFPDTVPAELHAIDWTRIKVKEEFRYSPTLTSYVLPKGDYIPVRSDAGGTYYQSPRGILVLPIVGSYIVQGGVYRRKDKNAMYPLCIYVYMPGDNLTFWDLHSMIGLNLGHKVECFPPTWYQ